MRLPDNWKKRRTRHVGRFILYRSHEHEGAFTSLAAGSTLSPLSRRIVQDWGEVRATLAPGSRVEYVILAVTAPGGVYPPETRPRPLTASSATSSRGPKGPNLTGCGGGKRCCARPPSCRSLDSAQRLATRKKATTRKASKKKAVTRKKVAKKASSRKKSTPARKGPTRNTRKRRKR